MTEDLINAGNDNKLTFPGKIAVITGTASQVKEDFHSAKQLVLKYGPDKIIHVTHPENFMTEKNKMIEMFVKLAADREIKVLIINQAVPGTNAGVKKLKELREDIFVVYCTVHEAVPEAASLANLLLMNNELGIGVEMVNQARKQGAKTFVHYSLPRHMDILLKSMRRDLIKQECLKEGINFVDVTALDPTGVAGVEGARKFIMEDVPRIVAKYGDNTAFFCTNCTLQAPLIKAIVDCHAIFLQPCCPSPYHGFPEALGIEMDEDFADLNYVISEACRIAAEKDMTDRLSTWPVSTSMMYTNAAAEYAIMWINGEVPKTGIDSYILKDCMNAYITDVVGEESNVYLKSYVENGVTYDNFKLILMSYLDF